MPSQTDRLCTYCGFDTQEDLVRGAFWTGQDYIVVEDMPAWLCAGCGEHFFPRETTLRIQDLLTHPPVESGKIIRTSVYSLDSSLPMDENTAQPVRDLQPDPALELDTPPEARAAESTIELQRDPCRFQCKYCQSGTVMGRVRSVFWAGEELIVLENIPARVCPTCQEPYYSGPTLDRIEALLKNRARVTATRTLDIPVFSLAHPNGKS
ncbi:MAG: YgiT-type zinc finger protein [bacterium]